MKIFTFAIPPRQRFVSVLLLAMFVGCGQSAGRVPVNQSAARDACETFLDAWKDGQSPEDLQPAIYGSDYVWSSGQSLISYEILPAESNHGTSLVLSAKLTLKNAKGVDSKSIASYTVGTTPVMTVVRDEL
jgi:hypothetical protein